MSGSMCCFSWSTRLQLSRICFYLSCFFLPVFCTAAPLAADEIDAILDLEFEDLVGVTITSVKRSKEDLFDSAAAVFVLTAEDIRRSSANTIPDLLRLVPGLNVAQSGNASWAISARGFQDKFSNKLLVMVDGRTIYTTSFGGVYWEHLDLPLQDIERIEVIRGPGGSVWGANAVNGVIHIITRDTAETTGWQLRTGAGNEHLGFGSVRYGDALSPETTYRIYAQGSRRDEVAQASNQRLQQDDPTHLQTGFRLDTRDTSNSHITIQGDIFKFNADMTLGVPDIDGLLSGAAGTRNIVAGRETEGGNILGRWTRDISDHSQLSVQSFADWFESESALTRVRSLVYDFDVQHSVQWSDRVKTSSGFDFRFHDNHMYPGAIVVFPEKDEFSFIDFYVNSDWFLSEAVTLSLGSKAGHNDYTGWEHQPTARLLWKLTERQRLWAAVSRAVRIPDRFNRGADFTHSLSPPAAAGGLPTQLNITGNRGLGAEVLFAYELGYRIQASDTTSIDLATFYNAYDDVIAIVPGVPVLTADPIPSVLIPGEHVSSAQVDVYGGELVISTEPTDRWRLISSYSVLNGHTRAPDTLFTIVGAESSDAFIANQVVLRSLFNVSASLDFDSAVRFVDAYQPRRTTAGIDSYLAFDFRIGWHLSEAVEVSFVGQNVFDSTHVEHDNITTSPFIAVERSFYWLLSMKL